MGPVINREKIFIQQKEKKITCYKQSHNFVGHNSFNIKKKSLFHFFFYLLSLTLFSHI